jgi:hypothetical protein
MATDIEILKKAREREDDPRRPRDWKAWEFWVVGATKDDIRRLLDQGYVTAAVRSPRLTKYVLTDKGRDIVFAETMERKFTAVPRSTILESMDLVVGFDDIKETIADAIASQRRINFMLEGPPACAKSVILECVRTSVPYAYMAFGSRTSAAGLSDVLFEIKPQLLLLDEVDKMRHDCYSVLLGLMEKGEILETKSGKTRGIILETMVIAACNSSLKMSPEFLSRFAFHPYFKEYSRQEFIDVCVGMLTRAEGCPPDVAELIGVQVYDMGLGDVRKARGVWQLMRAPTEAEVQRIIKMNLKYSPEMVMDKKGKRRGPRLPGF